jgi:hypothetical protein
MLQRVHCWGCPEEQRQLAARWHPQHLQVQHTTHVTTMPRSMSIQAHQHEARQGCIGSTQSNCAYRELDKGITVVLSCCQ